MFDLKLEKKKVLLVFIIRVSKLNYTKNFCIDLEENCLITLASLGGQLDKQFFTNPVLVIKYIIISCAIFINVIHFCTFHMLLM